MTSQVGAGVDLISACDIRYCTEDAWFSIAEVRIYHKSLKAQNPRVPGARKKLPSQKAQRSTLDSVERLPETLRSHHESERFYLMFQIAKSLPAKPGECRLGC